VVLGAIWVAAVGLIKREQFPAAPLVSVVVAALTIAAGFAAGSFDEAPADGGRSWRTSRRAIA
jgi:hypothetical protein